MMRNLTALMAHDLAVAFKNKTLLLMVCIPIFVYGTLMLVDDAEAPALPVTLGLVDGATYPAAFRTHVASATAAFSVRAVASREEGTRLLNERALDGLVLPAEGDPDRVEVYVVKVNGPVAAILAQRLSALQLAMECQGPAWLASLRPLQTGRLALQSLPVWILMVVLMVSFIVLPAQVAEEKEKQWLLGLLQTPLREGEWLAAKLGYGLVLSVSVVYVLQVLARAPGVSGAYLVTLGAGGFCFCAMGIALGLLCRNPASARTLGVICYLPLLVPAALADASSHLRAIARFLPSYAFFEPLESILLNQAARTVFPAEWLILLLLGGASCLLAHKLIRVRWLM